MIFPYMKPQKVTVHGSVNLQSSHGMGIITSLIKNDRLVYMPTLFSSRQYLRPYLSEQLLDLESSLWLLTDRMCCFTIYSMSTKANRKQGFTGLLWITKKAFIVINYRITGLQGIIRMLWSASHSDCLVGTSRESQYFKHKVNMHAHHILLMNIIYIYIYL